MSNAFIIKGFPDYYITDTGDVFSRKSRFVKLKQWKSRAGYMYVDLNQNGKRVHKRVHRLVAEAFIPNPKNKSDVNHKNGNKSDNRVQNLEWATHSENSLHAYRTLKCKPTWKGKFGKNHNCSKLVLQIKNGKVIAEFYGTMEAERQTTICHVGIINCCLGKAKHAGGFQWQYKTKE